MNKHIVYGPEARNKVVEGAEMLEKIVSSSLGPAGHNVLIYDGNAARPLILKDGATIATKVDSDDPFLKSGILLVKDIIAKVDAMAGDGTTTTTIYATKLMRTLTDLVNLGVNAGEVRKGLNQATQDAVEYLKSMVEMTDDYKSIAMVATNGNEELANLLDEGYSSIGENGSVVLADSWSRSGKSYVEVSKGIKWSGGIPSSLFITNIIDDTAVVDNPAIMVLATGVEDLEPLSAYIEAAKLVDKTLVLVAPYFEPKLFPIAAKKKVMLLMSPGTSFSHVDIHDALMDLAITVGTKVVPDVASAVDIVPDISDLGVAKHIVSSVEETNIVQVDELEEDKAVDYANYIEKLKKTIDEDDGLQISVMEGLKERLARLSGGIATIYVGALTPTEKEEKCASILDAQNSIASAIKYGTLPGGGTALLKTAQYLSEKPHNFETEAVRKGYEAVLDTMRTLAKRLVASVKPDDYQYIVQQVAHEKDFWSGYNVRTQKIEDLKKARVIDSAAIELFVLQYTASEIGAFIVSDVVIVNANRNMSYDMNDRRAAEAFKC